MTNHKHIAAMGLIAAVLIMMTAVPVRGADTITMLDGEKLEGTILSETETEVKFEMSVDGATMRMTVAKSKIRSIHSAKGGYRLLAKKTIKPVKKPVPPLAKKPGPRAPSRPGRISGWRGDGTGKYPDAAPPVKWARTSRRIQGLRCQAGKPKGDAAGGKPMADGALREWLILGPVDTAGLAKGKDPLGLEPEMTLMPAEGGKAGGTAWKALHTDTSTVDFSRIFTGAADTAVAYAHSYIYSEKATDFLLKLHHMGPVRAWLNGKLLHPADKSDMNYLPGKVTLAQGWNRLMVRVEPIVKNDRPAKGTWYTSVCFYGFLGSKFDTTNIRWKTETPSGNGFGSPAVAGDRLFVQCAYADLVCMDKNTGRILWVRSNNYNELATDEDRAAKPEIFKQIVPLAERLEVINRSFSSEAPPKLENIQGGYGHKEKGELEKKIYGLMAKVNPKKYMLPKGQDVGYSGMTPVSDGTYVWAWYATGATVCYDMEGKLIWRWLDNRGSFFEHGYSSSPLLVDDRLVVFMNQVLCFNAADGKLLWEREFEERGAKRFHGSFAAAAIGGETVVITANGYIVRLSDGEVLFKDNRMTQQQEIPTPVIEGDAFYKMTVYPHKLYKVSIPKSMSMPLSGVEVKELKIETASFPHYYLEWHMSSPVIDNGFAYLLNNAGVLTVVDIKAWKIAYQKYLNLDQFQSHQEGAGRGIGASLCLAGGNIYIQGTSGASVIIAPGPVFKQIAKNKIENAIWRYWRHRYERFVATPAFDGDSIYIRGETSVYCIRKD
ncbi:PQQ-binding-like beta-propeller repeat protein [Planctomycetota bacterium]